MMQKTRMMMIWGQVVLFVVVVVEVARGFSSSPPLRVRDDLGAMMPTTTETTNQIHHQQQEEQNWIEIPENEWRKQAKFHRKRIRELLEPGLTSPDHIVNSGRHRRRRGGGRRSQKNVGGDGGGDINDDNCWTALDPKHPIYNFLIEYYGLRGSKGPRRLARWFPDPALMLLSSLNDEDDDDGNQIQNQTQVIADGILLEGATEEDWGNGHLHLRGAMLHPGKGIVYSPNFYYNTPKQDTNSTMMMDIATPILWYKSILEQTMAADPTLFCFGLHGFAMQYHPEGADPPPSGKYQSHLPMRVSRQTINDTVERKGIRCTHVDALRYFAPAAGPFNSHGISLQRLDQLRLEQPACVHAHMDLIKIALRIQPFLNPTLIQDTIEIALKGRLLDVAASPYDATAYGIQPIPVETFEGRAEFQRQQIQLMEDAEPVRKRLLQAYDDFLTISFNDNIIEEAKQHPAAERHAKSEPGGMPWRKNLI